MWSAGTCRLGKSESSPISSATILVISGRSLGAPLNCHGTLSGAVAKLAFSSRSTSGLALISHPACGPIHSGWGGDCLRRHCRFGLLCGCLHRGNPRPSQRGYSYSAGEIDDHDLDSLYHRFQMWEVLHAGRTRLVWVQDYRTPEDPDWPKVRARLATTPAWEKFLAWVEKRGPQLEWPF